MDMGNQAAGLLRHPAVTCLASASSTTAPGIILSTIAPSSSVPASTPSSQIEFGP